MKNKESRADQEQIKQLSQGLAATLYHCMMNSVEPAHMDELGEADIDVAVDLGIAVQVAEEQVVPLPELMVEVFELYNQKLEIELPSQILANNVAAHYHWLQSMALKRAH
ncbi:MAG: hypothetical protein R3Y10_07675 [Ferrimonas sp.]